MPNTTAAAVITRIQEGNEEVLLTRRAYPPFQGMWCIPGGHIETQVTAKEAIVREVKEETGLDFSGKFFMYSEEIHPDLGIHNVALVFAGTATGTVPNRSEEVTEFAWVPLEKAVGMELAFRHSGILEDYLRKKSRSQG